MLLIKSKCVLCKLLFAFFVSVKFLFLPEIVALFTRYMFLFIFTFFVQLFWMCVLFFFVFVMIFYLHFTLCSSLHVCTGVLCGPCGPSAWLGLQQESRSREQQHRGADGVLSPKLVSIVQGNWIWSGRRDDCQWEPAIIRCEWDVWSWGWPYTHTHSLRFILYRRQYTVRGKCFLK